MYPFSFDLLGGAYFFAEAAANETDNQRRRYFNTSCIVFAAATIEAVLNEHISLGNTFGQDIRYQHIPNQFLAALSNVQKSISLKDKWNLFVSVRAGSFWDSAIEPFQSYDTIVTVRNELLHYKANFLDHLEPPINRIKPLVDRFHEEMERSEDSTSWLHALLESRVLGAWIKEKVRYDELLDVLLKPKP